MSIRFTMRALAVCAVAALSACTEQNVAWLNANGVLVDPPTFLGQMAREFRRETITIVNFEFDSDELDAEAMETIRDQAAWILEHPNVEFSVTGHTDKVGNQEYNLDLGQRRADRVLAALVALGVSEDRLIAQVSFGEEAPLIETEDRERANRRVVTEVLGLVDVGSIYPPVMRSSKDDDPEPEPEDPVLDFDPDSGYDEVGNESGDSEDDNIIDDGPNIFTPDL